MAPLRRGATIYGPDSAADSVYFVDSGFVKLVQRGNDGKEVMLSIVAPGNVFGEQALYLGGVRSNSAQVLQEGAIYQIPRSVFLSFTESAPEALRGLCEALMHRQRDLEQKVGLLCLHDVEYRILHYLANLVTEFGAAGSQEYSIPLSQSELAHLIGATRETTSTTLNNLARRGLLRLGRRMLMVSSVDAVRAAARERAGSPLPKQTVVSQDC